MKILEVGLNMVHYCLYKFHCKLHLMFNKINPFWYFLEMPLLKKRYEKNGIKDIRQVLNSTWIDETNGLSVTIAGGELLGILSILIFAVNDAIYHSMNLGRNLSAINYILFFAIASIACYWFVFKQDKYLIYVKEFKKWTKSDKRKYSWISLTFVILVSALFFLTL